MAEDNGNGQKYHITLNSYDRNCLEFIKNCHDISGTAAIRTMIRATAWKLGFAKPPFSIDDGNE
jgi:hypothetical protein